MKIAIYPPIGIARLGNSDEFFIGSERLGSSGTELSAGSPEVTAFKDASFRFRKQACRFHLMQTDDNGNNPTTFFPGAGVTVKWTLRLVNKKDAINRPGSPPASPVLPVSNPARANRVIDSGAVSVTGASAAVKQLAGTYLTNAVPLGTVSTDAASRLIVTGGSGAVDSPENAPIGNEPPLGSRVDAFYNNPGWYDDVSDGPVTAVISLADGTVVNTDPAWLIVGPPDAARTSNPVTSLHSIIRQMAIDQTWLPNDATTSFTKDIYPMLKNARALRWTHVAQGTQPTPEPHWGSISTDFPNLSKTALAQRPLRSNEADKLREIEALLNRYRLREYQLAHIARWENGTFTDDWQGVPAIEANFSPEGLLRSALEQCAGQGFFPGIEGGRIVSLPSIYLQPFRFRFDPNVLKPGDITALMALPWTADFLECLNNWWPAQRPDLARQGNGSFAFWHRPFLDTDADHRGMSKNVMRLGAVKLITTAADAESSIEEGRDPNL